MMTLSVRVDMRLLEIPFVSAFAIAFCETQLSAEDRSFLFIRGSDLCNSNLGCPVSCGSKATKIKWVYRVGTYFPVHQKRAKGPKDPCCKRKGLSLPALGVSRKKKLWHTG